MKFKEYKIQQIATQPPRRHFADDQFFDLILWYESSDFIEIKGFQLGYKENPFNTDSEYFITHRPKAKNPTEIQLAKTVGPNITYPSPKLIQPTSEPLPNSFYERIQIVIEGLPTEVRTYIESFLQQISSSR